MTREIKDIEHTNPHTGEAFGANGGVFTRGPAAADGGTEGDEMRNVEHEAPDGDGANEVWERGPETDDASTAAADGETDEAKSPGEVSVAEDTPADE
ncbi:hypothetical protein [Salinigranum rubrum]|uniref:hypothetical protein n=1 Tax=Salinigranum rubrum TaxID=755307 RepID=UPI001FEB4A86|nr:hypothetical protein [Salinigranum rubrum]